MYVRTAPGFSGVATLSLADAPRPSAADALALKKAATFAGAMGKTLRQLAQSVAFLANAAQQDLMREIVSILGTFFPSGYGVLDKDGRVLKTSARYRSEVIPKNPPRNVPFYFHHDTWLFVSHQKSDAAGRQRPFEPGHRCWIYLFAANLSTDIGSLADVLVHESVHMLGHRYRGVEQKFGSRVAGEIPTPIAGKLLNRSGFAPLRGLMEQHFVKLADFLNRQSHRAAGGSMAQLPSSIVARWGEHLVEEILAYVFEERASAALAQFTAHKTGAGISQTFDPMPFLKSYFRKHWLSDPNDRAALKMKAASQVFAPMGPDLERLVGAVRKNMGP